MAAKKSKRITAEDKNKFATKLHNNEGSWHSVVNKNGKLVKIFIPNK